MNKDQNFSLIRRDFQEFSRDELPVNIPKIVESSDDLDEIYQLALDNWTEKFNSPELIKQLITASETPTDERDQVSSTRKYLKNLSKAGLILKSAQRFSSDERNLPPNLHAFLKQLGKVNDAWEFEQLDDEVEKLIKIIDIGIEIEKSNAAEVSEFNDRVSFLLTKVSEYLTFETLKVEDYHKLRKYVRHLMNLFQLKAALYVDQLDIVQTFQYLCDLNSDLGDLHDEVVENDLSGVATYQDSVIVIPDNLRRRVILLGLS